jgi:hypothetical protein
MSAAHRGRIDPSCIFQMKLKLHFLAPYRPAVRKVWLQILAGVLWLGIGIMLISIASRWLKLVTIPVELLLIVAGLALATPIYLFGFSKMAKKNIHRIGSMAGERVCLFAFQGWKSYPLVAIMIALGIYLRVYSPFPKPLLAILYMGIGGGLFGSSLHYFAHVRRMRQPVTVE